MSSKLIFLVPIFKLGFQGKLISLLRGHVQRDESRNGHHGMQGSQSTRSIQITSLGDNLPWTQTTLKITSEFQFWLDLSLYLPLLYMVQYMVIQIFVGLNTIIYVHPVLPEQRFSTGVNFAPLTPQPPGDIW